MLEAFSTLMNVKPNPNWAQLPLFDRSKWESVRFGDVVDLVSDTSRNPEAEGITRFIGMEHLEPGSLHIKTWGELVDGVTFTKRCRKGQVLFGKRRAYQRKVAIAEFDAVVSGDIYVFQAKEELLDPKLLPFLCMSERFFQFAVETSAGSLSPRTNWSHLKDFEFILPPLDQQRRIAELLWAVDEDVQESSRLAFTCDTAIRVIAEEACWHNGFPLQPIVSIADPSIGKFIDGDWIESKDQSPKGVKLIQLADIGEGEYLYKSDRWVSPATFDRLRCTEVLPGDILISRMAEPIGRACIVPDQGCRMLTGVDCTIVRLDKERHEADYWIDLTNTSTWRRMVESNAAGSTRMRISRKNLEALQVPIPDLTYQQSVSMKLRGMKHIQTAANDKASNGRQLMTAIMSSIE